MDDATKSEIRSKLSAIDMSAEKIDEAIEELAQENDRFLEALRSIAYKDIPGNVDENAGPFVDELQLIARKALINI